MDNLTIDFAVDTLLHIANSKEVKARSGGMEIMERVLEIYYSRLNNTRAMISNLFKMFRFQTGMSKFIETYYER